MLNYLIQLNNIRMLYQLHSSYLSSDLYNSIKRLSKIRSTDKNAMLKQSIIKLNIETCSAILCLRTFSLSRIFRATGSPVSEFLANLTLANVPSPIVLPTSYLPTLRFTCCLRFILKHQVTEPKKSQKKYHSKHLELRPKLEGLYQKQRE